VETARQHNLTERGMDNNLTGKLKDLGGKVKDASAYGHVERKLRKACAANGLDVRDWFDSATPGSEGAREFFLHATRAVDRTPS